MKSVYYNLFFLFSLLFLNGCHNLNQTNNSEKKQLKNTDTLVKSDSITNENKKDTIFLSFTSDMTYSQFLTTCYEFESNGKIRESQKMSRTVFDKIEYEKIREFEMVFNGVQYYFEIKVDNGPDYYTGDGLLEEKISYITLYHKTRISTIIPNLIALYKEKYGNYQKNSKQKTYTVNDFQPYIEPGYDNPDRKKDNRLVKIDNIDSYKWPSNPKIKIVVITSDMRLSKSQFMDDFDNAIPVNYTVYEVFICYYSKKFLNKLLQFEEATRINSLKMKKELKNKEKNIINDI